MKILLVDNHTKNLTETKRLLEGFDFSVCEKAEFSIPMADPFDLIIFSGGSSVRSVKNHSEEYSKEIDFVKQTDKKIIGIFLGCEIVATAFGCSLKELPIKEKGILAIKFRGQESLIYEAHKFIIEKITDDIEIIATSNHGIEAIKHRTKPIYGLQFHPEMFVDKLVGDDIFIKIIENI